MLWLLLLPMEEKLLRPLGLMLLALGITMSAQAAPRHHSLRDATNGGCGPYYYRGVGGNCVQGDGSINYHPDPYWTPCDYSQGPQIPEGCAE
jgi:hypothetical protein